jgi:hypothetical protein
MRSGLGHGRPHKFAPCQRTLSCAADFDHKGSQGSAPCWRTLSYAADFNHKRPQGSAPCQRFCPMQRTSTTKGLKDIPLIIGFCLAQKTLITKVSKKTTKPQQQMMQPVANRVQGICNNSQTTSIHSKAKRWDGHNAASYDQSLKILLAWTLVDAAMAE